MIYHRFLLVVAHVLLLCVVFFTSPFALSFTTYNITQLREGYVVCGLYLYLVVLQAVSSFSSSEQTKNKPTENQDPVAM